MRSVSLLAFLAFALAVVSGCDSEAPPESHGVPEQPAEAPAVEQPSEAPEEASAQEVGPAEIESLPSEESPAEGESAGEEATAGAGDLEPIPLELPKPLFPGTPPAMRFGTHVEKRRGKPRPPFLAPKGTKNVALGKPVTSSDPMPIIGELAFVTNDDREGGQGHYVELAPGLQHVQIDLGAPYAIYAVVLWHYHQEPRVYHDVVVQVADDADFITGVRTLFNNDYDNSAGLGLGKDLEYIETSEGKLIDAGGAVARYVRLYSGGSTSNDLNHYVEVEVYGKPVP
jgi:hypothetical protein